MGGGGDKLIIIALQKLIFTFMITSFKKFIEEKEMGYLGGGGEGG